MTWHSEPAPQQHTKNDRGYSLLEMLVVLTIIALIAALTPAAYRNIRPGVELRSTSGEVAALLRKARSNAILTGRDTVVVFDLDQNVAAFGNEETSLTWSGAIKVTAIIAESERVDGNRGNIRFFGNGGSTGGKLHLQTSKMAYDVSVDWLLGTVEVKKSDA